MQKYVICTTQVAFLSIFEQFYVVTSVVKYIFYTTYEHILRINMKLYVKKIGKKIQTIFKKFYKKFAKNSLIIKEIHKLFTETL